jgi:uncharacterized protein YggU (UPF0235/DUF167 family)
MALIGDVSDAVKESVTEEADKVLGKTQATNIRKYPRFTGPQRIPYLSLKPRRLTSQAFIVEESLNNNRDPVGKGQTNENLVYQFALLKDSEINENYTHRWEETQMHTMVESGEQALLKYKEAQRVLAAAIRNPSLQGVSNEALRKNVWSKVDAALIYKGSERRTYTFRIGLVTQRDPYNDVIFPIRQLQSFSCAEDVNGDIFKINPPEIFELEIVPAGFIKVENAALTDVQVNYSSHFHFVNPIYQQITTVGGLLTDEYDRDGYPKSAEISLTFLDLMPLYKSAVGSGDVKKRVTIKQTVDAVKDKVKRQVERKIPDVPLGPFKREDIDKASQKWRP